MKAIKWLGVLLIVMVLAAGCREFTVVEPPAPPKPVTLANLPANAPTVLPQAIATPDKLVIQSDAVDQLLSNIYERANPAVVNIDVAGGSDLTELGSGSGFVVDQDGHIVTNNHVIDGADEIDVTFWDGTVATAKVIGADPYSDLALIKVDVDPAKLDPLTLGDSDQIKVGQRVIAIGNPFGLVGTMTVGIVSGKGRTLPADTSTNSGNNFSNPDIIQTDAAINPGNSGGPLLNSAGEVIGVNSAIRTDGTNRANSGVGFAVPSNTVKRVVTQLQANGRVSYPYLGVSVDSHFTTGELALALNLPVAKGVVIATVVDGGPAERAGLKGGDQQVTVRGIPVRSGGDIITAIDGDPINSFDEMIAYLAAKKQVGQTVTVTVLRGAQTLQVPLTLDERPR
ncbi:MAG TPA: trypsin-like peptidase domain-containing protein [Anaerolineae bacterium]|nr:trypsin-like peptidase domain-containing protein [Anaerolineae bacterium]